MESRAKLAGHAIHPMLIVFPLGLLGISLVFDIAYFLTSDASFAGAAFWNITAGIIGGLLAALFGLVDWLAIPNGTRAKTIGAWHAIGNVGVMILFAVSWQMRWMSPGHLTTISAFVLSLVAVGMALMTAWLGGELVERLSVGVDHGAHLDAPSSLSDRPASEGRATDRPARAA